jgi:hypothetical protein
MQRQTEIKTRTGEKTNGGSEQQESAKLTKANEGNWKVLNDIERPWNVWI